MSDPFEPTPEELLAASELIAYPPADQPGTLYSEREFMENLLVQRLNALLVVYAVFVAAAFASKTATLASVALLVGSGTCFLMARTVKRAHYKHHWIMRIFYNQPAESPASKHPIKIINDAMKRNGRAAIAKGSVSDFVGKHIPNLCWASLFVAGLTCLAHGTGLVCFMDCALNAA